MENREYTGVGKENSPEVIPSLIKVIVANEVDGFDNVIKNTDLDTQSQPNASHPSTPSAGVPKTDASHLHHDRFQSQGKIHSVSISMPPSPMEVHLQNTKRVLFRDDFQTVHRNGVTNFKNMNAKELKYHSQPMPLGSLDPNHPELPVRNLRLDKLKDGRYNSFKTWSGKLERQLSHLGGRQSPVEPKADRPQTNEMKSVNVDRYFDALEGPELDTLRASEEIILPEDKQWPFLLRYTITAFGICLGISSQAIMWKALSTSTSMKFLHVSPNINLVLWFIAVALVTIVTLIYSLKVIFYFEAVRREYYHPIRVNFFFAPFIAFLFVALGVPPSVSQNLHQSLWYILMAPIFVLELKIYGQWMSGGQRRLSKVANPSNHLSVVGNFVGALLGASMGLREGPIFFFAVGMAHYTVLFVTLYQRLPTNETLPKELHPVFFLFVAAPSVASMAWANIQGSFDYGARIAYFIAMFLYFSLAVRINFFRGFRFSLAWWAYTFPMTGASIATIKYSNEVPNLVTKALSIMLCSISTFIVIGLLITTIVHAFVLRDLFPNDIAIAISQRRAKTTNKRHHRRFASADNKDIENYLKFEDSDDKDVEASATSSRSATKE